MIYGQKPQEFEYEYISDDKEGGANVPQIQPNYAMLNNSLSCSLVQTYNAL